MAYAFCIMSRRTGGALRSAIRRTWAQSIGGGAQEENQLSRCLWKPFHTYFG